MNIVIAATGALAAEAAAAEFLEAIVGVPDPVIGLATGSSPQPLYAALAARVERGDLDLGRARGFALDEYVGIPRAHPESYHSIIERDVILPLRMDPALVSVPDGQSRDVDRAAEEYESAIAAQGGIDVQVLGIGSNGHIGFNEPGSPADSRTRRVALTAETRRANSRFFGSVDEVPTHAVSQGLATIMSARRILLLASGRGKAAAIRAAAEGPVVAECPASLLQRHPHATLYLDEEAAAALKGPVERLTAAR